MVEFVALMALLTAVVAFSMDSMLPQISQIGLELSPERPNLSLLVITTFTLGLGCGTLFVGVLADRFGRKAVILSGLAIYAIGAVISWSSQSIVPMLIGRFIAGMGGAAPRIVTIAMIRDIYSGREMARIMSFVMTVFSLVPALAPSIGALLAHADGWRTVFLSFVLFALIAGVWVSLRQPETLPLPERRPIKGTVIWAGVKEVFAHPIVRLSLIIQALFFGTMFTLLSTAEPLYHRVYGVTNAFPLWFGLSAVIAMGFSLLNARIVMRFAVRNIIMTTLSVQVAISLLYLLIRTLHLPQEVEFVFFFIWTASIFAQGALTMGNLNTVAMMPMGHIAGLAASVLAAAGTIGGTLIATAIGQTITDRPEPVAIAVVVIASLSLFLARGLPNKVL
ncbi:major facilitator superfamily MFS_1 [Ketogulonicigenium robustum]|uniref:Major facilitator superfamily MFS_1 n=1 Tax=Ketogulonicigenium robustum TaxID=92947 RepID=A0A1W6NZB7_9RHOB|nr:MFS transporter [Ketogulonicigenium robustum]ARO14511.1 major facilitator superfamily MFS_1 [Ketogulonicigenium robustum]